MRPPPPTLVHFSPHLPSLTLTLVLSLNPMPCRLPDPPRTYSLAPPTGLPIIMTLQRPASPSQMQNRQGIEQVPVGAAVTASRGEDNSKVGCASGTRERRDVVGEASKDEGGALLCRGASRTLGEVGEAGACFRKGVKLRRAAAAEAWPQRYPFRRRVGRSSDQSLRGCRALPSRRFWP